MRINDVLNEFDRKIQPTDKQIKLADEIYDEICVSLLSMTGIENIEIIKQGSYKNKTLTITNASKDIDLDILVGFKDKYEHSDSARSAIANNLRSKGFDIEVKTRVVVAKKDNFKVDILPAIASVNNEGKFLIREKSNVNQKTIDPKGYYSWMSSKKLNYLTQNNLTPINRDIDPEGYRSQIVNLNINKAIRILKAIGYEFKKENTEYVSSHFIESMVVDSYKGATEISAIISDALDRIKKFADENKNFYNPNFPNEVIVKYEAKSQYINYIEFARNKIREMVPSINNKTITIAGVSIVIGTAATSIAAAGNKITPIHGS